MLFVGKHRLLRTIAAVGLLTAGFVLFPAKVLAVCSQPTTNGTVTLSNITVSKTATYRVWTRMQIPDSTNDSFYLEINGGNCITVHGDGNQPKNTWAWVDFQSGSTTNKIAATFNAGTTYTFKMIGAGEGVLVDKIVLTEVNADGTTCIPQGLGTDCTNEAPSTQQPGDTNGDGNVSITDLNAVINNWGGTNRTRELGDLNGDGKVSISDLNQVLNNWTF